MKTVLHVVLVLLGVLVVGAGGFVAYAAVAGMPHHEPPKVEFKAESTPARVERGRKLTKLLCVDCHRNPETHLLTGARMIDGPPEFGPIVSRNITRDPVHGIGGYSDSELAVLLRTGIARDGRYIPPYMAKLPHMADEDLASIIAFLRSDDPLVAAQPVDPPGRTEPSLLTKVLSRTMFGPLSYPYEPIALPPESDKLAYGRYLVVNLDCWTCHSADFKTMNIMEPERTPGFLAGGNPMLDLGGRTVPTANITPDVKTGIGSWVESDFIRAMHDGVRPDGRPILYPMGIMPELTVSDLAAMFAYLKSVPAVSNPIDRAQPPIPAGAEVGKKAYYQYGCYGCHGDNGAGLADLRRNREHYPSDEALIAWIKNAPALKPGVRMPKWEGVIPEAEFAPLAAYVRQLGDARTP